MTGEIERTGPKSGRRGVPSRAATSARFRPPNATAGLRAVVPITEYLRASGLAAGLNEGPVFVLVPVPREILESFNTSEVSEDSGSDSRVQPLFVSVPEAAELLGLGESTVKALIRDKRLRSRKVGSRRLVSVSAIRAFDVACDQDDSRPV